MYVYLSKILSVFVMPVTGVLLLSLLALVLMYKGKLRLAKGFLSLAILLLWFSSLPVVGEGLYRKLESRYPPIPLADVPESGCIVVLGGVVQAPAPPRLDIEFNDSVDRVHKAAELFRAGKAPYLVVTGGNQPWSTARESEAELIRDLLVQWGVPREAIILEGSSRNTRENALYTKNIVDSIHCGDVLLVTSAAHMPRSVAAFQAVGIPVTAVSTDVRVASISGVTVMDFLPDARALEMTTGVVREMVGQWVYEIRGWN
jgi:uncharacterized SAM-binding protein YcdF (DUF218 family)